MLTVDGRALHAFLQAGSRFNDWIERRVAEYEFREGADFYLSVSKSGGGRTAKEYMLSLDMAKELSMVERTAKGRDHR